MTTRTLPTRIAASMAGAIGILVVAAALSVLWMARALDAQAREESGRLAASAVSGLLSEMHAVLLEYARWDDAVVAIGAGDWDWIYPNVGSAAATGLMTDMVVLWGGPLGRDVGWIDQSPPAGLSRLVPPAVLAGADQALAAVPVGEAEGARFFLWRGSDLFAASAARIEWTYDLSRAETNDARIPRMLMGRRIGSAELRAMAEATLLGGLDVERRPPVGRPSLPLAGADGAPVAWLSWDVPRPGTDLLVRMLPPLAVVLAAAVALAAGSVSVARAGARRLVRAERRALAAARVDAATGLPNRTALNEALARPAPAGERAVLFLDVDGFKRINDSLGHAGGDAVIGRLAERLGALADADCSLARVGGDEFVFLVSGPNAGFRVEWLGHAVERALAAPLDLGGRRLRLRAAMGHAVQGGDGKGGDGGGGEAGGGDLLRQADLAMHEAKRRGDGRPVAFGRMIEAAADDARAIEAHLREALRRPGEIAVAYQPIVEVGTGRLHRAEALARWRSPALGVVPPDRFIAVAERSGLIAELGRRLLRIVCDDLAAHPGLRVSLNASPIQIMGPDFASDLVAAAAERGIEPERIEVEMTETVIVDDPRLAAKRIEALRAAGFPTALDDFGTGFSSIGTLRGMRFGTLKVDRAYVSGIGTDPRRLALLNAMVLLAHALDLRVVCEGVEEAPELDMLRELGCDLAQGYHIDRPQPIERLAAAWLGGATHVAAVA